MVTNETNNKKINIFRYSDFCVLCIGVFRFFNNKNRRKKKRVHPEPCLSHARLLVRREKQLQAKKKTTKIFSLWCFFFTIFFLYVLNRLLTRICVLSRNKLIFVKKLKKRRVKKTMKKNNKSKYYL